MTGFIVSQIDTDVDGLQETRLIAIAGEDVLGLVGLAHHGKRSAYLRQLFVAPDFRRQGIGSRLVNRCCDLARMSGCQTVGLSLSPENSEIMPFYEQLGFSLAFEFDDGITIASKLL